jgi:hypothetical protein
MKARIPNTIVINGKRKTCRIFDLGEKGSIDRFTIAYRGWRLQSERGGGMVYPYVGCSSFPFHPQGIGQHGESREFMTGKHLGKRIRFEALPTQVQQLVVQDLT